MVGTLQQQLDIEKEQRVIKFNKYVTTYQDTLNKRGIKETQAGSILLKLGYAGSKDTPKPIHNKVKEFLESKTTGQRKKDIDLLRNITEDIDVIVFTTLSVLFSFVGKSDNKIKLVNAARRIVDTLVEENIIESLRASDPKMFKYMDTQYRRASKKRKDELMQNHINNMKERADGAQRFAIKTPNNVAQDTRIGVAIIECVIASGINLFEVGILRERSKQGFTRVVRLTTQSRELLTTTHQSIINSLMPHYPPMVYPPKPWTNNRDGGMYSSRNPIMKMNVVEGFKLLKDVTLDKVYPVLNKLQNTSWHINEFVLDTIQTLFDNDMIDPRSPRKLKRLYGSLPTATPMETEDVIRKQDYGTMNDEGIFHNVAHFKKWRMDYEAVTIALDGEMGRRLQLVAALAEAQEYRKYDSLWFGYNLDSRGRVYTLQTLITPQSNSTVKSLLRFAEGELLTERGEHWFKIHTANVFGKDKDEYPDRLKWFDNNIDCIRRVGSTPLDNLSDWTDCDSPFEFLAACHDWVSHEAGKKVYVPIQLDATNSGVQIYSGLLGDLAGAETVNVVNMYVNNILKRADVYGIVASRVNSSLLSGNYPKMFHVELSDGTEKSQSTSLEANSIAGNITRKHTKRNTMTVPYSVTKRGMSQQLWDLMDEARLEDKEWWDGDPWVVNKLLTDLNHDAIYDTIPGAKIGQDYLVALADLCNGKEGMIYTTPIYEIPVIQKRPRTEVQRVRTQLGMLQLKHDIPNSLDKMAQKNGSAPNFIHSIDSTLLLYMVENMSKQIGVIHDCFISHANDGDEMQLVFKKGFVEIMRMKPLELLGEQLDPEGVIKVPYIGTLDLDRVMDAEYIIS